MNIHSSKLTGSINDSKNSNILEEMVEDLDLVVVNGLEGNDLGILRGSDYSKKNGGGVPYTRYSSTTETIVDYALLDKKLLEFLE